METMQDDAGNLADSLAADLDFGDIGLSDFDLDLDGFDLDGFEARPRVETRYVNPPLYVGTRRGAVRYEYAQAFARDLTQRILAGERIDAIVSGNFIFGDFLEAFAVEADLLIDDLTLSTLSISRDNVDSLQNLIEGGYLAALNIVVSDYWFSHNRQNLPYIYERLDVPYLGQHEDRFQLAVAGIHTKITLLRIGERKIVMHGSANLRSSRSLEHVTIETSPEVYDFHHAWHHTILENYATVNKSVRASDLYSLIGADTGAGGDSHEPR